MKTALVVSMLSILALIIPMDSFAQQEQISLKSYATSIKPRDSFLVLGKVDLAAAKSFVPVRLSVVNPEGELIYNPQLKIAGDGSFKYLINPTLPRFMEGTYTVTATHPGLSNSALLEFTVVQNNGGTGVPEEPITTTSRCSQDEFLASNQCIPFEISGGTVSSATINPGDKSIVVTVSASSDGTLTINPSTDVISGINMVLMDGKKWDGVQIDGNQVTVEFNSGTHSIEFIGTYVIPEFGTFATIILITAIVSMIVLTSRNKMLIPKI